MSGDLRSPIIRGLMDEVEADHENHHRETLSKRMLIRLCAFFGTDLLTSALEVVDENMPRSNHHQGHPDSTGNTAVELEGEVSGRKLWQVCYKSTNIMKISVLNANRIVDPRTFRRFVLALPLGESVCLQGLDQPDFDERGIHHMQTRPRRHYHRGSGQDGAQED